MHMINSKRSMKHTQCYQIKETGKRMINSDMPHLAQEAAWVQERVKGLLEDFGNKVHLPIPIHQVVEIHLEMILSIHLKYLSNFLVADLEAQVGEEDGRILRMKSPL